MSSLTPTAQYRKIRKRVLKLTRISATKRVLPNRRNVSPNKARESILPSLSRFLGGGESNLNPKTSTKAQKTTVLKKRSHLLQELAGAEGQRSSTTMLSNQPSQLVFRLISTLKKRI